MDCKLKETLKLRFNPVAIIWSDSALPGAVEFAEGRWGCVMSLFSQAARGKTVQFSRRNFGCLGGGVGLGFGNQYKNYVGGIDCFYRFLSSGNQESEEGQAHVGQATTILRREAIDNFLHGERYVKTPELAKKRIELLPTIDIPYDYVRFKPVGDVDLGIETPQVVIFPVNPDQLSALVFLTSYARESGDNVAVPFGAGCHNVGIMAYAEAEKEHPKAIIGLTDLSARRYTANSLGHEFLTFAVPYKLFQELENNIDGSFLQRQAWRELME